MSGFSAIFQRDGRPLNVPVLQRMNEAIGHRGPDGSGSWVEGPIGLAQQVLHATPDALRDTQPAVSARGTLVPRALPRLRTDAGGQCRARPGRTAH